MQTVHVPAPSNFRLGREGLARLLERGSLPRAVFCSSDTSAHGVLIEAQARGMSVPGIWPSSVSLTSTSAAHTFPIVDGADRPARQQAGEPRRPCWEESRADPWKESSTSGFT